jgi:hypothetical protein
MLEIIEEHLKAISLVKIKTKEESESFRISYLGKKRDSSGLVFRV